MENKPQKKPRGLDFLTFYLALWVSKLSLVALRLLKRNGTNFPGRLALKLCPDFLSYVSKPPRIVTVTGTNGKTTCTNMITDILALSGRKVLSNVYGSNTNAGIASVLLKGVGIFNRSKYEIAVLEVDERSSIRVYPAVTPDVTLIINLFRDSQMRNAHPEYIAQFLTRYIPRTTKLVINADDLISIGVSPENERVYFSIAELDSDIPECINLVNDVRVCPKCFGKLTYDRVRCHHIGRAHCDECGFASPKGDFTALRVDEAAGTMLLREADGAEYTVPTPSKVNPYDALAVAALLRTLGMGREELADGLGKISITPTRHMDTPAGNVHVIMHMAKEKNAVATSRAFDFIKHEPHEKEVFLMVNCLGDERHWSENTCWIYDCDFEFLNDPLVTHIVAAGPRCLDYKLRLLMAGVPEEKISCERDEEKATHLLRFSPGSDVYMLYGTDSMNLAFGLRENVIALAKEAAK